MNFERQSLRIFQSRFKTAGTDSSRNNSRRDFNNHIHRVECLSWLKSRIDIFIGNSRGDNFHGDFANV